ncbi:hypothetical protein F5Y10DRAFT_285921 [Nemania abortiva]|nr:hypothetical protein F5Y10DRAFT_285921 [Nemania abortiva]
MNQTHDQGEGLVQGWVSDPIARGSASIIWSSFLAIFLCTWTTLCLNVPHPNESDTRILLRKAKWMLWGIFMPEVVLSVAIGQYASAQRSVQRFRDLGHPGWTLRHAFFADMGGLLVQPNNDSAPFLVNNTQLAFLIKKQYLECPRITTEEIWDRSKADFLSKTLAFLQASWLAFQVLGRSIAGLPATALELFACAIVICTLGNFICWLHKPNDVRKAIILNAGFSLEKIVSENADAAAAFPQYATKRSNEKKSAQSHKSVVQRLFRISQDNGDQQLQRFTNDTYPELNTTQKLAFFCLGKGFAACHLAAWNSRFPTKIELYGWRIASSVVLGASLVLWAFEVLVFQPDQYTWDKYLNPLRYREVSINDISTTMEHGKSVHIDTETVATGPKKGKNDGSFYPLVKPVIRAILVPPYVVARLFLVVEALISLRALPCGAYQTLSITDLFAVH